MATFGTAVNYLDLKSRLDPDNKIADIVEMTSQMNEVFSDMKVMEGNLPTGHRTTIRTGLPTAYWRLYNKGVVPGKSTTAQVTENCGMLEAYAEIDKRLAQLNGWEGGWRLSEDSAFLESMTQEVAKTLFHTNSTSGHYGNPEVAPEKPLGLPARFSGLSTDESLTGINVIDGGADGSTIGQRYLTSVWLVGWGEKGLAAFYPKGTQAGFQMEDLGEQTVGDSTNGFYQALRSHYMWDVGFMLKDWRYVVRGANVSTEDIALATPTTTAGKDIVKFLIQMEERLPTAANGLNYAFYLRREMFFYLRAAILGKISNNLTWDTVAGKRVLAFDGIPIRRIDQIGKAETRVTAST